MVTPGRRCGNRYSQAQLLGPGKHCLLASKAQMPFSPGSSFLKVDPKEILDECTKVHVKYYLLMSFLIVKIENNLNGCAE